MPEYENEVRQKLDVVNGGQMHWKGTKGAGCLESLGVVAFFFNMGKCPNCTLGEVSSCTAAAVLGSNYEELLLWTPFAIGFHLLMSCSEKMVE